MKLQKKLLIQMLKQMIEIRAFEEKIMDMYARGEAVGVIHLSIGQEAVAVGTCANLKRDDFVASTHRGHHHCIAKGGDVKLIMAELFARRTGYCKGKGGSMHIIAPDIGFVAAGIAGSGIPIAIGAALSAKLRQTSQ
ncbi:MAG: thiamine pyrophosphate-dependent enzyme, partial [Dehalococcoidia bacterium]|nr:thiamine pyrophosphate-dependent enzyme [Dehalococcoidia bacterium]